MKLEQLGTAASLRVIGQILTKIADRVATEQEGIQLSAFVDSGFAPSLGHQCSPLLASLANAEYQQRRDREKFFEADLLGEPAWDILLDLFVQEARDKKTSVTSACIASGAAPTTALRYIEMLVQKGLVEKVPSTTDSRVTFVRLTSASRKTMTAYLARQLAHSENSEKVDDVIEEAIDPTLLSAFGFE
ncbi:MAG: hypothetical protein H6918_06085 [Sphingomonadaceae bacterium]|nr:hypothetical protein [Sphingomonadaceae bacterium]